MEEICGKCVDCEMWPEEKKHTTCVKNESSLRLNQQ